MNPLILSAGIGEWYTKGVERLKGSLIHHGYVGDIGIYRDEWPDNKWDRSCVYHIKAAALERAMKDGYKVIIWADASVFAVKNPMPFVHHVTTHGHWLGQSGYNGAQTCTDAQLAYFGITRDQAEKMHDCATGLFGLNLDYPESRWFAERWIIAAKDGAFKSSRLHAGQSSDPRFKFGRQDQSCATIIASQMGWKLDTFLDYVNFKWDNTGSIFRCEGM